METVPAPSVAWVVLTQGDRPVELHDAVESIKRWCTDEPRIHVLFNGVAAPPEILEGVTVHELPENLGIPGGRDAGLRVAGAVDVVFFLDDDARLLGDVERLVLEHFTGDDTVAAVSMRLVDEAGSTARRHVPRPGRQSAERSGDVVSFLGGACAIRRKAYEVVGGYWAELWYGHEELDLAWRFHDLGMRVIYESDATVFHPRSPIGRHESGWRLTGRNRVLIARRRLPVPVLTVHVLVWLVAGSIRARGDGHAKAYVAGWRAGWSMPVERHAMSWATVWRLARLGRPPIV